jgi:transposase-like protein
MNPTKNRDTPLLTSRRLVDTVDMEENTKKETKVRRKFDREFKNDAVRLVELSNRSVKPHS